MKRCHCSPTEPVLTDAHLQVLSVFGKLKFMVAWGVKVVSGILSVPGCVGTVKQCCLVGEWMF